VLTSYPYDELTVFYCTGVDCPPNDYANSPYNGNGQYSTNNGGSSFAFYEPSMNSKRLPHRDQSSSLNNEQNRERWQKNPFCMPNIDVTNFLNLNSYADHSSFCLAYVFTYRDFSGGTLGLAWVAEPGGSGGVCEWYRPMREGTQNNVYKSLNTGIVTLLNYGSRVSHVMTMVIF
jgi:hypothetical protein